ncbi:MAG: alpha/beta fold hydrolase [Kiritimatiellia bacterium]
MLLHYTETSNGIPLVILHGLLGSSRNWRGIAVNLSNLCRVFSIDLPNHGSSPHMTGADLRKTCDSVVETIRRAGLEQVYLLGHSMGGKIGMQISSDYPEILKGLIVADMLPKAVPPAHLFILRACEQLDPAAFSRRTEIDAELAKSVPQYEIRSFVLKNIARDENNRFYWQINLPNIIANYRIVSDAPDLRRPYKGPALFLGGENSPYKIATEHNLIRNWFPEAEIQTIADAGHLLHTDQPKAFSDAIRFFVRNHLSDS